MRKKIFAAALAVIMLLCACPTAQAAYGEMSFSDGFVEYIKKGEGFSPTVYYDSTGSYIGYGCLCDPADYPNGISEEDATALLRSRARSLADAINRFLKKYDVGVTQGQFDALCGFAYNFGTSWLTTSNRMPSYLVNGIENYTDQQIATSFAAWCHVGGKAVPALIRRRIQEVKMFLYDDYSYNADGWCWIIMDSNGGSNEFSDVAVYKEGEAYATLPVPTRPGYYFAGWQTSDGRTLSVSDTVTESLNVKAAWSLSPTEPESAPPATPSPQPDSLFPDVPTDAWYYDSVAALVSSGVIQGFDDGTFRPDDKVTCGQALRFITAASGFGDKAAPEGTHWAQAYLDFAVKSGFVKEGSITDLDAPMSRLEIAGLVAAVLELGSPQGASPYADVNDPAATALYEKGLMVGSIENGSRYMKGGDSIKRSEICSMVCRISDYTAENFVFVSSKRVPIDFSRELCAYDTDGFYTEDGRVRYSDGVTKVSYGIDVSYYQGNIDWQKVAADGIEFAIIRAGYRTYSSASLNEDIKFRANLAGAKAAGIQVGVYFFSQAITEAEARQELDYLLALLDGEALDLPITFDWEPISNAGSRTGTYDGATITACARAFLDGVKEAGYTPMIYFNKTLGYLHFDLTQFDDCAKWLAYYNTVPDYVYDYDIWQYGSSGSVDGITGNVDMNIAFNMEW